MDKTLKALQLLPPPFFHNRSVSFWNLPPALRGAIGGRHHRWPQGGSRNLPHCWCLLGSHQNPPASSEQPPGKPKLNKGLLELLGVAACPTWALHCQEGLCQAGQGRNSCQLLSGEKGPQVSLFPALHREGDPRLIEPGCRPAHWKEPRETRTGSCFWAREPGSWNWEDSLVPFWNLGIIFYFSP